MLTRGLGLGLATLLSLAAFACGDEAGTPPTDDDDLTSVTARSRTLEFEGTVYVAPDADDASIMSAVRLQAQTAFGPLRTQEMAVNSRELKAVDARTFKKRNVEVVDGSKKSPMLEVKYTYSDNAVVAASYSNRSAVPLALMNPGYKMQLDRVLGECTANDEEARGFRTSIWYVFEPKLDRCQDAIRKEQAKVDADRKKLKSPRTQVAKSEVERLYLPIQAKLGADKTNQGNSYPDYDRLFAGGVEKNKLVISFVYGMIDHSEGAPPESDPNWEELTTMLVESAQGFEIVPGGDNPDLGHFDLPSGRRIDNPSFDDLVAVHGGNSTLNLDYADNAALDHELAHRLEGKWLTVERQASVQIGGGAARDFAIRYMIYFGAGSSSTPHRQAIKTSDVFLYNGHSSIGYGPLDPKNFTAADFPSTYQIMWIDSCVSYNYYEKDYVSLKQGGTKNLDLITNGIEAPAWRSGHAMAQFINRLTDGSGASYRDLLVAAEATESLRVVDGELDNTWTPANRVSVLKK
jgi:hypothetical protein